MHWIKEYKQVKDTYYALIVVNGLGGLVILHYGLIATPVPGCICIGYITFAV